MSLGELSVARYQGAAIRKGDGRRILEACVQGYGGSEAVRCLRERREFNVFVFDFVRKIKNYVSIS